MSFQTFTQIGLHFAAFFSDMEVHLADLLNAKMVRYN